MGIFDKFRKRPATDGEDRRTRLLKNGRITDGIIKDTETDPSGAEIVFYLYTLNGVDFESSDILSDEQRRDPIKYAPGAKVAIRYDPRNQGNSVLE